MDKQFEVKIIVPDGCRLVGCRTEGDMAIVIFEDTEARKYALSVFVVGAQEKFRMAVKRTIVQKGFRVKFTHKSLIIK